MSESTSSCLPRGGAVATTGGIEPRGHQFARLARRLLSLDRKSPSLDRKRLSIDGHFPSVDRRFPSVARKFLSVDRRRLSVDRRFPSPDTSGVSSDGRFPSIDRRFPSVDGKFPSVDGSLLTRSPQERGGSSYLTAAAQVDARRCYRTSRCAADGRAVRSSRGVDAGQSAGCAGRAGFSDFEGKAASRGRRTRVWAAASEREYTGGHAIELARHLNIEGDSRWRA